MLQFPELRSLFQHTSVSSLGRQHWQYSNFLLLWEQGSNISLVVVCLKMKTFNEYSAMIYLEASCTWVLMRAGWLLFSQTARYKQLADICQRGVNKSGAGAVRLVKRHQLSPHDPRLFSELSIFTLHQDTRSIQGQKTIPMIVSANEELTMLGMVCFLRSSTTSSSSRESSKRVTSAWLNAATMER